MYINQYIDVESGRILCSRSIPWHNISIGTPEYQIHCIPDSKLGDSIAIRKAVKEKRADEGWPSCRKSDVFDPRSFLIPGRPIWETLPGVLQHTNKHGEFNVDGHFLKVEERTDGGITEYRIQLPGKISPTDYLFMTMVFSSDKDFNIVSLETTRSDGKLFQKNTWDYDLVDGVYLPNKTTKQNFAGENARLSYERKSIFRNSRINHAIPQEMFSYKNLGLKNGDKFVDKILGREYTYQDEKLIPTEAKK